MIYLDSVLGRRAGEDEAEFDAAGNFKEGSGGQSHLFLHNLEKTAKFIRLQLNYVSAWILMGSKKGDWGGFLHGCSVQNAFAQCTFRDIARGALAKAFQLGPLRILKRS